MTHVTVDIIDMIPIFSHFFRLLQNNGFAGSSGPSQPTTFMCWLGSDVA